MRVELSSTLDGHDAVFFNALGRNESSNHRQFSQFTSVYSILLLLEVFGFKMVLNAFRRTLLDEPGTLRVPA
jgi:hypothetical protein